MKAGFEPAPSNTPLAQHLADVVAGVAQLPPCSAGAPVPDGIPIIDLGIGAVSPVDQKTCRVDLVSHAVGLTGDQLDGSLGRLAKGRGERVVVQRITLGVVP